MPLYAYRCLSCQKAHEVIQKFSDPALKKCPHCGGSLEKEISRTSFQLKGGGWYKDGYGTPRPEKKGPETADKKDTEKKEQKQETKKPEAKKEEKRGGEKKAD